jgi:hypothetical protein
MQISCARMLLKDAAGHSAPSARSHRYRQTS